MSQFVNSDLWKPPTYTVLTMGQVPFQTPLDLLIHNNPKGGCSFHLYFTYEHPSRERGNDLLQVSYLVVVEWVLHSDHLTPESCPAPPWSAACYTDILYYFELFSNFSCIFTLSPTKLYWPQKHKMYHISFLCSFSRFFFKCLMILLDHDDL